MLTMTPSMSLERTAATMSAHSSSERSGAILSTGFGLRVGIASLRPLTTLHKSSCSGATALTATSVLLVPMQTKLDQAPLHRKLSPKYPKYIGTRNLIQ